MVYYEQRSYAGNFMKDYNSGFPFCPVPCALMTFFTATGQPQIMAIGWMGVVCSRPALLSVTWRRSLRAAGELPAGGDFCVSLPPEELLVQTQLRELLADEEIQPGGGGLTLQAAAATKGILIPECPVTIECRRATFSTRGGQPRVSGEVVAVHLDGEVHGLNTPLDLYRLKPFTHCLPLPELPAVSLVNPTFNVCRPSRAPAS